MATDHRGRRLMATAVYNIYIYIYIVRDPVLVHWPRVFGEAWGTKAKKPPFSEQILFGWGRRLRGQGQNMNICLMKIVFLGPWYPRSS